MYSYKKNKFNCEGNCKKCQKDCDFYGLCEICNNTESCSKSKQCKEHKIYLERNNK